jgi:hypothetical protein
MPLLTQNVRKPWLGGSRLRNADPRHDHHEPGVINAV